MVKERLSLRVDFSQLIKGLPSVNLIGEIVKVKERFGIKEHYITIKNKEHRKILSRHLLTGRSLEVEFYRCGKKYRAYLRIENTLFILTQINFYQMSKKETVSLYNGHKRRLFGGLVDVFVIDKRYLLQCEDFRMVQDGEYFVVFRKGFYRCHKAGENLYFSGRERVK